MEIRVMQWNLLAHGLANDGFLVARPNEEGASLLDRARSVQVLGQVMKQRIKKTGKKIKLKDLPEEVKSWDPPPFDFAQRLKNNFEEILHEEQRYLQEITNLPKRCEMIAQKIKEEQPDVIAFQEMDMFQELNPLLEAAGYSAGADATRLYGELAQRVKDLGIESKTGTGGQPKDFAAKYRELLVEYTSQGLCFCPNFASTARYFNKDGFDDGVAIYWKTSTMKPRATPDVWTYDMTGDAPAIRVKLTNQMGSAVDVITLHLPSSPGKELRRQLNLWQLHELLGGAELSKGPPLILAVDLNSDAHLQPPLTQEMEIPKEDGSASKGDFELVQPLRQSCFQLLSGAAAPRGSVGAYAHPRDVEAAQAMAANDFPTWDLNNAWGDDKIPLSVVKMRGPASDQVKKWGELTLETTDHVFCSHHFRVLQCDTGYAKYNQHDKQDLLKRFKDPQAPNQQELVELLKGLIPSASIPSDHMCVIANLQLAHGLQLGDRVVILATKQQPKALEGTVKFIGSTEFSTGEWLGIELDSKAGKNDGTVQGKTYFNCPPEYGLFLRPAAVEKLEAKTTEEPTSAKAKVQAILALAMEDHDVETLRRVLPEAERLGIDSKEIHFAHQIAYAAAHDLQAEVNGICSSLVDLRQSIEEIQASASSSRQQGMLYQELERRLLSKSLPKVLEEVMASTEAPSVKMPEGSVKQKFRKNLVAGLKDGSLQSVVKSMPDDKN